MKPETPELQRLIDALDEGVLLLGPEGTVSAINAAGCRLLGLPVEAVQGRLLADVLRLEDADGRQPTKLPDRHTGFQVEARLVRGDKTRRPVLVRTAEGDGRCGPVVVISDRFHEAASVEEARRNAGILATAQRLAHMSTWEWDIRTDEVRLSDAIVDLFGTNVKITGLEHFLGRVHPDDRARVRVAVERALAGEEGYDVVFRLLTGNSGTRVVRAMADVHRENGRPVLMSGAIQDITEQRTLEARLAIADRMVSVGTLAAGVAHEINNPLAYVVANTSFAMDALRQQAAVRDSPALSEAIEALSAVREGAERIRVIVRDLKTFSRPVEDKRGPVDVKRAMESALMMAGNEIRHRANLVRDYESVPIVEAEESRLGQLFLNLIVNAAQAIPEGAMDRNEIRVSIRRKQDRVCVEVRDTGIGIRPEILPRIFDPFFTTKPVGEGTGLGLAVCHGIVTSFGGEIEVDSQVGRGTTFRVLLPAGQGETTAAPRPQALPKAPSARSARLVVIDDEPALTAAIRRALMNTYDVMVFNYAGDALAHLAGGATCDAILCDLMMPRMTGMDFHEELAKARPELTGRVIFLTGGAFTARAREFLASVSNPRLEKPFDMTGLAAVVAAMLREKTPRPA